MASETKPTLYMMLGYPGAGKTTIAEHIATATGAVHLNSDRFRLHLFREPKFTQEEHDLIYRALDYQAELLLASGVSVIYDANLNLYIHRKSKYDIAKRAGATAKLIWVRTDEPLAKRRAVEEADGNPRRPYGNMSPRLFNRLVRAIEVPREDEPVIELSGGPDMSPENTRRVIRG